MVSPELEIDILRKKILQRHSGLFTIGMPRIDPDFRLESAFHSLDALIHFLSAASSRAAHSTAFYKDRISGKYTIRQKITASPGSMAGGVHTFDRGGAKGNACGIMQGNEIIGLEAITLNLFGMHVDICLKLVNKRPYKVNMIDMMMRQKDAGHLNIQQRDLMTDFMKIPRRIDERSFF